MASTQAAPPVSPVSLARRRPRNLGLWVLALVPPLLIIGWLISLFASPVKFYQLKGDAVLDVSRQTVSQNLLIEHPGLRSLKLAAIPDQNLTALTLHLRETATGPDIRTSPANASGEFSFAPLEPTYTGRTLFALIEGPGKIYYSVNNVYRFGALTLAAQPTVGDLRFELDYGVNPSELMATFWARQNNWGGPAWLGLIALVSYLTLWAVGGFLLLRFRQTLTGPGLSAMTFKQFRWVAAYFLGLGLAAALMFMSLTPPLMGLDEQAHVGRPVFQYEYDARTENYPKLFYAATDIENRARFVEYIIVKLLDYNALATEQGSVLAESHQAPIFYAIAGGVVRLSAFVIGDHSLLFQSYMVRLTSVLFSMITLSLILFWAYYMRRSAPWMFLPLLIFCTFLPTYTFPTGIANNDVSATCFITLLTVALTVVIKEGHPLRYNWAFWRRWWPIVIIAGGAFVLAFFSKRTVVIVLPGMGLGLAIYGLALLPRRLRKLAFIGIGVLLVGVIGWLVLNLDNRATGWRYYDSSIPARIATAPTGEAALELTPANVRLYQERDYYFDDYSNLPTRLTLSGQVYAPNSTVMTAGLETEQFTPVNQTQNLQSGWQSFSLSYDISQYDYRQRVAVYLSDPTTTLYFKNVALAGPDGQNRLVNTNLDEKVPSFKKGNFASLWLDFFTNQRRLDTLTMSVAFSQISLTSFWANMGWIELVTTPSMAFWLLFWIVFAAVFALRWYFGMAMRLVKGRLAEESQADGFGYFSLIAGLMLLSQLFLMVYHPLLAWYHQGGYFYSHGRFLNMVAIPIVLVLLGGLRMAVPKRLRMRLPGWVGPYLWGGLLMFYGLTLLVGYYLPFYYNRT